MPAPAATAALPSADIEAARTAVAEANRRNAAQARVEAAESNIPQSSVGEYESKGVVSIRFTRFTAHQNTAYQRHQVAGFTREVADELIRNRRGIELPGGLLNY